jgi:hypothetical protein
MGLAPPVELPWPSRQFDHLLFWTSDFRSRDDKRPGRWDETGPPGGAEAEGQYAAAVRLRLIASFDPQLFQRLVVLCRRL